MKRFLRGSLGALKALGFLLLLTGVVDFAYDSFTYIKTNAESERAFQLLTDESMPELEASAGGLIDIGMRPAEAPEVEEPVMVLMILCSEPGDWEVVIPGSGSIAKAFQARPGNQAVCGSFNSHADRVFSREIPRAMSLSVESDRARSDAAWDAGAVVIIGAFLFLLSFFQPVVIAPPGTTLRRFARVAYTRSTYQGVFEPIVSDMHEEYLDVLNKGSRLEAYWKLLLHRYGFLKAVFQQLPFSLGRILGLLFRSRSN